MRANGEELCIDTYHNDNFHFSYADSYLGPQFHCLDLTLCDVSVVAEHSARLAKLLRQEAEKKIETTKKQAQEKPESERKLVESRKETALMHLLFLCLGQLSRFVLHSASKSHLFCCSSFRISSSSSRLCEM